MKKCEYRSTVPMSPRRGNKRLHVWLMEYLDKGTIEGVQWLNKSQQTFRIPWMHQSRKAWQKNANEVFIQWETYRGRKSTNVKQAKATFRMAINSAKRKGLISEVEKMSKDASDPCIIYKFTSPKKRPSGDSMSSESSGSSEDSFDEELIGPNHDMDDDDAEIPTTVAEVAKHRAVNGQLNAGKRTGNRKKPAEERRSSTPSLIGQTANQSDEEDSRSYNMEDCFSGNSSIDSSLTGSDHESLQEIELLDFTFDDDYDYTISLPCETIFRCDPEVNHH